ncbi:MAG: hypothetical protein COY42_05980 [Armatimonadetes bacterium CG_4_10_14_0_8_um_filter_66_14]|nr:hypothetical protein [Armatimonadota bacterium]PIZ48636.1 MAG: hypothetical protein COY42_05980 [Armatimonadetes bacterium CG_4_10_14_0_8_um_filter_66_14]
MRSLCAEQGETGQTLAAQCVALPASHRPYGCIIAAGDRLLVGGRGGIAILSSADLSSRGISAVTGSVLSMSRTKHGILYTSCRAGDDITTPTAHGHVGHVPLAPGEPGEAPREIETPFVATNVLTVSGGDDAWCCAFAQRKIIKVRFTGQLERQEEISFGFHPYVAVGLQGDTVLAAGVSSLPPNRGEVALATAHLGATDSPRLLELPRGFRSGGFVCDVTVLGSTRVVARRVPPDPPLLFTLSESGLSVQQVDTPDLGYHIDWIGIGGHDSRAVIVGKATKVQPDASALAIALSGCQEATTQGGPLLKTEVALWDTALREQRLCAGLLVGGLVTGAFSPDGEQLYLLFPERSLVVSLRLEDLAHGTTLRRAKPSLEEAGRRVPAAE